MTCHTRDNYYTNFAKTLEQDFIKYDLPYLLVPYTGTNSWHQNTHMKPRLIKQVLESTKESVVFLDADARILKEPKLFYELEESDIEMAGYKNNGYLCSGTLYFKYTPNVLKLLDLWIKACDKNGDTQDDTLFDKNNLYNHVKFVPLPVEYCSVSTMTITWNPVISHSRASFNAISKALPKDTRTLLDKSIALLRTNPVSELYLNQNYDKVGERWFPRTKDFRTDFKDKHKDQIINIVGKGPSLSKITSLGSLPTIGLNDSIYYLSKLGTIDNLYCVVQDNGVLNFEIPCTLFCSPKSFIEYRKFPKSYVYVVDGAKDNSLSACIALKIAKFMGAKECRMLAFDACTNGDCSYDKNIKMLVGNNPQRFRQYCDQIKQVAEHLKLPLTWVT